MSKGKVALKFSLAVSLLVCLFDMPYGYYQLVRFVALIGFSLLAYESHLSNSQQTLIIYIILAILFQPFWKVALGRELWNIVDFIVAIGLLLSIIKMKLRP